MINLSKLLIIFPWLLMGSAAYAAIDPTELRIERHCVRNGALPDRWEVNVDVIVPKTYDLADRKIADEVVSAAYTKVLEECPPPRGTKLRRGRMTVNEEGYGEGDRRCFFTEKKIDCPDYLYRAPSRRRAEQQRAAELAQRHAAEEQQRQSQLETKAPLDEKTQAFADKHGVDRGWIDGYLGWKRLHANPFSYEGGTFLFRVKLERMISPTSGIFDGFTPSAYMIVTGLPRDTFLDPKAVLLAAKVTGASEIKTFFGGTMQVPQATYVGHVFCESEKCKDYAGTLRCTDYIKTECGK